MKRYASALLISTAALAIGCVQDPSTTVGSAIPRAQDVRVNLPENDGAAQAALGELSEYYALTRGISAEFNAGAAFVLILVHAIVQHPATTIDGTTYTWGPYSEPLAPAEWRLVVTDNLDGSYAWSLDGRSKIAGATEFDTAIAGLAIEGADPHRGSGNFALDFDVLKALDPIEHADSNGGMVEVTYDLENRDGTQASLTMHIEAANDAGEPIVADYLYAENEDRSGDFQFSLPVDVNEDGSALEDVVLRSRWLADGSGRGDARVTGGDAGAEVVEASQCWDTSFRTVYEVSTHDFMPESGDAGQCAFADQDLPAL